MSRRRVLIVVVALPLLVILAGLLYLRFADLSGYRGWAEKALTGALGREVAIAGRFEPRISRSSSLLAEKITLANPDGSMSPAMVQVERLAVTVDLWSLISGPILVHHVEIQGARVLLEVDGSGAPNWELEFGDGETGTATGPLEIVVERIDLADGVLTYNDASREEPLELVIQRFDARMNDTGKLEIGADGRLNGVDVGLTGKVGPLEVLLRGSAVDQEITGHLGDAEFSLAGSVEDLATLGAPDLAISAEGPDVATITSLFGLPALGQGPFHVEAQAIRLASGSEMAMDGAQAALSPPGVEVALNAVLGSLAAEVKGNVKALLDFTEMDLMARVTGPDLQAAGALFGLHDLPADTFGISGRVRRDVSQLAVNGLEAQVGDNRLTADGVLGSPPLMLGTDFTFRAEGSNLAAFAVPAGLELPAGRFQAQGRLVRQEAGVALESVDIQVGEIHLKADGLLGDPPGFQQTDLVFHGAGPDLKAFDGLAGVALPAGPFESDGRLAYNDAGMALENVTARLGMNILAADGTLVAASGLVGTDLRIHGEGPELARVGEMAGRPGLPEEPYEIDGRIAVKRDGYELSSVEASLGDVSLRLDGLVGPLPDLAGTELDVRIAGPDVGWTATLGGLDGLPPDPYQIRGRLRMAGAGFGDGYLLDNVDAMIGDVSVKLHGRVGPLSGLQGTDLEIEARGESLLALAPYLTLPALPDEPFAVSGGVRVEPSGYGLEQVTAELGAHRLVAHGKLGQIPELLGTDLAVQVSGEDFTDIGRFMTAAGLGEPPELPEETYALSGQVLVHQSGYEFRRLEASLGQARLVLDGRVGPLPDFHGTDLALDAHGPDASFLGALAGIAVPGEPFLMRGGVERHPGGVLFRGLHVELGELRGDLDGTLGEWPRFIDTELDFRAEGASLLPLAGILDRPALPDDPFQFSGHFSGNPESFRLQEFHARLGESDMSGSFRLGLEGKPDLHGEFRSEHLDLTMLSDRSSLETPVEGAAPAMGQPQSGAVEDAAPAPESRMESEAEAATEAGSEEDAGIGEKERAHAGAEPEPETDEDRSLDEDADQDPVPTRGDGKQVIPGEPLDLDFLEAADIDVRWTIDELLTLAADLNGIEFRVHLEDGRLDLGPVNGVGEHGGRLEGTAAIEPVGESHRFRARLKAENVLLDALSPRDDPLGGPRIDLELALDGLGGSWRELMSDANGYVNFVMKEGRLDSSALNFLAADVLMEILDVLNPFRKKDPYTGYECAVILVDLKNGLATLEPLAVRTSKMTVVGHGKIAFTTEKLDLSWAAKPRKGVGLSASAITNPYIKLGGTLAKPSLDVKPIQSATATGAAVATAGISILARGLWDRATAERKVCAHALKEAERRAEERAAEEAQEP